MPVSPVPKLGEDQDMEVTKDQEEETTKPKPNPSEVTSPPDEPASPRATVEVNIGEPHPSPVSPGANQVQKPEPKEEDKQATSAKEATGPKEQATSLELVESPKGDGSSSSWAVAREALSQPKANHPEPDYNLTMTFTVKMRKDVNPCHSRYHPQVKVTYSGCHQAGDTSLDLVVVGLGGSRIVTHAPHRPGVVWKLSTYPQDPEVQICRVFGAITPGLIKKAGVHKLWEQGPGANQEALWVNLIEMEALTPLPTELSDTLTVALAAKIVYVRTLAEAIWASGLPTRRLVACRCSSSLTSMDGMHMRRASTQSGPTRHSYLGSGRP